MTPKNTADPEDNPLGVLDEAASLDTAGIGILGRTAQVSVTLPKDEDDDLADDGIVEGEVIGDLVIDPPREADRKPKIATAPMPPAERAKPEIAESTSASTAKVEEESAVAGEIEQPSVAEPIVIDVSALSTTTEDVVDADVVEDPNPDAERRESTAASTPDVEERDADDLADERAAAARFLAKARSENGADRPATSSPVQASAEKETPTVSSPEDRSVVPQPVRTTPRTDVTLTSKRLDDLGESSRESADLLTADRLLDPHRVAKPEPEGAWSHFLYAVSGRRINIGDGRRARERKALSARIAAPLAGGARFVPVLSRKGGVGKTTITALLGMALADAREDRVIAVDANPDRGTLAERIVRPHHSKSVRDLVRIHDDVKGYHDISAIVARDATRLDVLASDADPRIAEAFSDSDYRDVADVAAHYYSLVLTDTGTGIVHSVMSATLDLADQIVIVSGLSVDEARLASETLTWLETNGYAEQAREAIVVLNQSTPGTPLVRLNELQAHFATRARSVVRVPYDPQIAGGGTIVFANLLPETRVAARELAALLVEGLRARAA
ncbi:nucleotide-binding protein [Microbacterium algeriense]|uniref:nucleotide-binding protein n=1 Tax=Microbacterium algeriense TaxID=2615184 RepID=UPI0029A19BE1|nr:AAA family ATPase [Microbacterium algeriense]MDX2400166.1 AAA family ATPase [Microbacterium algeriense]